MNANLATGVGGGECNRTKVSLVIMGNGLQFQTKMAKEKKSNDKREIKQ
jgi:hypothetical protein